MKLTKAIEIQEQQIDPFAMPQDKDRQDALKLGIEAMKRLQTLRNVHKSSVGGLLPGETKE